MRIIGINNEMYISSACLLEDGNILAAGTEERFTRQKLTRAFPQKAIEYCLQEAGIAMEDVDYVANSWNPGVYFTKFHPLFSGKRRHLLEQMYSVPDRLMHFYGRPEIDYIKQELTSSLGTHKIYYVTHHRAHAANGFFFSPFDSAAILTADAQGEFESTTLCHGEGNQISLLKRILYPHSLGSLYSTITEYLGFRANSDEWKVMAMASFANPENTFYSFMKEQVFTFPSSESFELDLRFFQGYLHEQPRLFSTKFVKSFGPPRQPGDALQSRHFEIAAALQKVFEEIVVHLLSWLYEHTKEKCLVLSGGAFMNSVFNGKVLNITPFEHVFISSCPDDSGNCFGAASYLYHHILGHDRSQIMSHNYYGPSYSNQNIKEILAADHLEADYRDDICEYTANLLHQGYIVGWFQGKMEFGQRALGNRSILADPRRADMKDIVNKAVKFREPFRPFAPAVLKEHQEDYFECGYSGDVPFMEKVYPIRPEQQHKIPAVVHVDGTGRLQSVDRNTNPLFYTLIQEFANLTGIPMLLNTSFNLNGEPIVCSPQDAIKTFYSCGLDALVLGNFIIIKEKQQGDIQ